MTWEEYIAAKRNATEAIVSGDDAELEAEEQSERAFFDVMDRDGDGKLSREEWRHTLAPSEEDNTLMSAIHLIWEYDLNKDGHLDMDEVHAGMVGHWNCGTSCSSV